MAGAQRRTTEAPAATDVLTNSHRFICLPHGLTPIFYRYPSQSRSSSNSLDLGIGIALGTAIHNGRVALTRPKTRMCATIFSALRPVSVGTDVQQAGAPTGGSDEPTSAVVIDAVADANLHGQDSRRETAVLRPPLQAHANCMS
jgi:hypothetical protein